VPYTHAFEPRPGDPAFGLPTPPTTPTVESEEIKSKMRVWIHGNVSSLSSHSVTFTRLSSDYANHPVGLAETIDFDYLVYALGASLPSPVDVWGEESSSLHLEGVPMGCKRRGVGYMHQRAETMKRAKSVLVVGGGALGIREWAPCLCPVFLTVRIGDRLERHLS
jgi:NADH dehydrogenase FAD-containing subunit